MVSEHPIDMGPKKDLQTKVLEEKVELMQTNLRKELEGLRSQFQHLPKELDLMKSEVLRLPAMEKKMDLLVTHLVHLLQATGKPGVESSAMNSDRLRRALEETGSTRQQGARSLSPAPPIVGEPSVLRPEHN